MKKSHKTSGAKNEMVIKGQGSVPYAKQEELPNPGLPKSHGAGKSRGGGASLRGNDFKGVF